ncbi:MAG: hypothetical protein KKG99_06745 [Bacteroidetes bacterium]|nr:hypothetical protein [Bacteroidota bacterium]
MCNFIAKEEVMAKNNWLDQLFTAAALIGGAWLTIELIKTFGEKKVYYSCPNCGFDKIEKGLTECPSCKVTLSWSGTK